MPVAPPDLLDPSRRQRKRARAREGGRALPCQFLPGSSRTFVGRLPICAGSSRGNSHGHIGHIDHVDFEAQAFTVRETSAVSARRNLGDLLNQVQYRYDAVLVTRNGKPVAALVGVPLLERIRRLRDECKRITDALAKTCVGVDPTVAQAGGDDDAVILATLVIAEADQIVTGDAALVALADRCPIVTPAEFAARHPS